jgi:coenzyme F420-0:L-glutamate ligase/coenzyme F420-1:gamma-L-glutamate ligase
LHQPQSRPLIGDALDVRYAALAGVPKIEEGHDLAATIVSALAASGESLRDGDVLVLAQKIVSKAEGRIVALNSVMPSASATQLALEVNKDPRVVELILNESCEVVRKARDLLVVAHKLGFVMANAGIDMSNVQHTSDTDDTVLLLPEDPDASCARLRKELRYLTGADVGVIINDSHGRAFRNGTVGVAIGVAGIPALVDWCGKSDLFGRKLQHTMVGLADEIASAASLLMGQAREGRPIILARGVPMERRDGAAVELVRPKAIDVFRAPSAEMVLRSRRSVRRFVPKQVPDALVRSILETATCAPSAHNRQPWRFAIVTQPSVKRRLAAAMGDRLRADRLADGDDADAVEKDVARSFARIDAAPTVIVVCLTMEDMDRYPDANRSAAEHQMAVQGTAMATQNLLLAAHAAGLGANVMCGPLFCPDTVRAVLSLPADWEPQGLVTMGYPDGQGRPFRRRPLSEVTRVVKEEL